MNRLTKLLVTCLLLAVAISGTFLLNASAQDSAVTSQQIEKIRSNCVSTKNTLNQLHESDALLRVNIGQTYESMSTKLMVEFNTRVTNNNFNNTGLVSVTTSYMATLDTFRSDYKTYEEQLSSAIAINCSSQPVAFYNAVTSARTKRNQVHTDVLKLNQYIAQYQSAIDQFEKDYQVAIKGVKK
jgi:outer membrane murein-binding lipoprotein Lpp